MTVKKSQCWNVPEHGFDKPAFTVVQEDDARPYVIGGNGPRILTVMEQIRWAQFKQDLARRY